MQIVVITRHFEDVPESDCLIIDLDLCTTEEELIFKKEIEDNIKEDYIENISKTSKDILTGCNLISFKKLNFASKLKTTINGTIQYGPIIIM